MMTPLARDLKIALETLRRPLAVFLGDVGQGMLEISHNMLALIGIVVIAAAVFAVGKADVREAVELRAYEWLQARQDVRAEERGDLSYGFDEPRALARATATDPTDLTRQQAAVANWISRRYHVAPEPVSRLVQEAWEVGRLTGLQPTLILAIMAVESSFNPFAQSPVGAQGLMQVMTQVHNDKYEAFGGKLTAFDPITNLRVGVLVLKECIARAGSLELGLRHYVGAANLQFDGGYAGKVLAEQQNLNNVAAGRAVAITAPMIVPPSPSTTAATTGPTPTAAPISAPGASQPLAFNMPAWGGGPAEVAKSEQLALLR